jgi:hypothetical protein
MKLNAISRALFLVSALVSTTLAYAQVAEQHSTSTAHQSITSFDDLTNEGPLSPSRAMSDPDAKTPAAALAAAPPLSKVFVYAVGSTNCGWEYMTAVGQLSTTCDHGGTQLRSAVLEIGYGSNPVAWMNGSVLPASKNYQTNPVCVVNGFYSWPCPAGYTVVGFLRYYNLDGNQNGLFRYQNTSTNSPWNTIATQISIL